MGKMPSVEFRPTTVSQEFSWAIQVIDLGKNSSLRNYQVGHVVKEILFVRMPRLCLRDIMDLKTHKKWCWKSNTSDDRPESPKTEVYQVFAKEKIETSLFPVRSLADEFKFIFIFFRFVAIDVYEPTETGWIDALMLSAIMTNELANEVGSTIVELVNKFRETDDQTSKQEAELNEEDYTLSLWKIYVMDRRLVVTSIGTLLTYGILLGTLGK
ncbi:hypothetical protein HNY73_006865 [Argiope bruennichi]|uniref:Uncharacterized protein n=1 Tax=Argiope bruennichi TaxID=94029 RepID=A0A8T0FD82_ARGBR|nr:hypothetical protein HNY73_006865 [Argiope bruennichi]